MTAQPIAPPTKASPKPIVPASGGKLKATKRAAKPRSVPSPVLDHACTETHPAVVEDESAPPTISQSNPTTSASGGKHKATKVSSESNESTSPAVSQASRETHTTSADGELAPPTKIRSKPMKGTSGGTLKATIDVAEPTEAASPVPDHVGSEHLGTRVGDESDTSQATREIQVASAGDGQPPTTSLPAQSTAPSSGWLELRVAAEMVYDAQKSRIAASNRAERGGVDPDMYRWYIDQLEALEHALALDMRRIYRRVVPAEVVAWQKTQRGIGEHLLARLLGHLGDPYIMRRHEWLETPPEGHICDAARCGEGKHLVAYEPAVRSISQLRSYCGVGDPLRKRRAGMTQEEAFGLGSPICKTLIHLLAEACMKQPNGNKYRDIYTAGREKYVTREDWKPGRQHNAALRLVKKELLRDLWIARHRAVGLAAVEPQKKNAHDAHATSQSISETPTRSAGGEGLEEAQ